MSATWFAAGISFLLFLFFQAQGISAGDSGDLVTAAVTGGVPHPPGYPLYTLLGWLASKIPFGSPAWRVTLLSSVSHALTIGVVYALVSRLTKRSAFAGVFAGVALGGQYVFFLYSVTAEVFALFDLFVVSLFYILVRWEQEHSIRLLTIFFFLLGLSLTHHHVIMFLFPGFAYFLYAHRKMIRRSWPFLLRYLCSFALGLSPLLYIPIAAHGNSIINWDRAVDLQAFIRLVTRADYGTFVSGGSYGQTIYERLLSLKAYAIFLFSDWTFPGIVLAVLGVIQWYRRKRVWYWTFILWFAGIGPLFLFYASFPLANRFTLGTYERFLLPGYVLLAIAVGVGLEMCLRQILLRFGKKIRTVAFFVFLLYPVTVGVMTLWRNFGLSADTTADHLGSDILTAVAPGSVVLLFGDTTLFPAQYVRYALKERTDVALIHGARLPQKEYQHVLRNHFPDLLFPDDEAAGFTPSFIKENRTRTGRRVYSNIILPVGPGWYFVPRGLLYEIVEERQLPSTAAMYQEARTNWSRMNDPTVGMLGRYVHLLLSDVLDVYATGHIVLGKTLARAGMWQEAKDEFNEAVRLSPDANMTEALEMLGLAQLVLKDCAGAIDSFQEARARSVSPSSVSIKLESLTYGQCSGNAERARFLLSEYERLTKISERPLEGL